MGNIGSVGCQHLCISMFKKVDIDDISELKFDFDCNIEEYKVKMYWYLAPVKHIIYLALMKQYTY